MHRVIKPIVALAGAAFIVGAACTPASQGAQAADTASDSTIGPRVPAGPVRDSAPAAGSEPVTIAPVERGGGAAPALDTGARAASGEQGRMARLEREARAIAKTTGCSTTSACRTAPVGARACGGPRSYIVYCAASTDTVALFRKLRELERVEKAYNDKSGMMSTCEMRLPPTAALVGGVCREKPAGP
jgi:hypothetical protein